MRDGLEEVVDVRSGIAYLLVHWKMIVLITLLCAALGGALAMRGGSGQSADSTSDYERQLEAARAQNPEYDALYLEQLTKQYKFYSSKLNHWGAYVDNSVVQNMDPNSYVKRDIQYAIVSDNSGVIDAFASSLLGQTDYQKIGELLGLDPNTASLQELISISDVSSDSAQTTVKSAQGADGIFSSIMNITVIGADEAAVTGIQTVLEEAVAQKSAKIQKAGTQLTISKVDEVTNDNDSNWLVNRQRALMEPMISLQTNRSDYGSKSVNGLSDIQKKYVNLLLSDENADDSAAISRGSFKKLVAAGGLGGFMVALIALYLIFILSGKIHSESELTDYYKLPVLQRFKIGGKQSGLRSADLIRNEGYAMLGAAHAADSVDKGMGVLAAEIQRRLDKTQYDRIFVAYDCNKENVRKAAEKIASSLSKDSLTVVSGNPLADDEAYHKMLQSDAVIMAETLNVSKKGTVKNLTDGCKWNEIPIMGYVTLIDM